jgi:hypothetical protein
MNLHRLSPKVLAALIAAAAAQADIIAQWDFNATNLIPNIGSGTAANVGGTSSAFAGGVSGQGWNTSAYPAQGTGSGTAGVSFFVDTTGYQDITLSYFHRASGTASRWAQIDYTLDGGATWVTNHWNNSGLLTPHDTFYSNNVSFISVTGANNNPNFGIRIVSIFSPFAFDQNDTLDPYGPNEAYMRANAGAVYSPTNSTASGNYSTAGTWRFDNVTFSGNVVPEPSVALLFLGGLSLCVIARRRLHE